MFRATTPTHQFVFADDPDEFSRILITYSQGGEIVLEKEKTDLTIEQTGGGRFRAFYTLTQEESSLFFAGTDVLVQVRALTSDGIAVASEIKRLRVDDVLNDEVLS